MIYIGSYIEGNKVNPWETKYVSEKGGIVLKHFFKYYLIYIGLFLIYISIVTKKKDQDMIKWYSAGVCF